jgi:3-oxoadipate enol-lactonase
MMMARVNGIDINYRVRGQGPTLVMAHGLMGSIATMPMLGDVSDLLWDRFRVVNYDARGHGQSGFTTDPADYTWPALADDMYHLLRYLGIERAHIGGGSMGAGTSAVFALDHPEMVEKLVLVTPPPMLPETFATAKPAFLGLAALIERDGLEPAVNVAVSVPPISLLRDTDPKMFEWMRQWLLSQNAASLVPAIRGVIDGPRVPYERFVEIEAPTLVVAQEGDAIHPIESAVTTHERIRGSRLVTAPDPLYWSTHREELAAIIRDFLLEA